MKKTSSRLFYVLAILLGALFVIACLMGFAACGDSGDGDGDGDGNGDGNGGGGNGQTTTYTFEAEDAKLWADESEMWYWLENDVTQGNMITGMGFLYAVQEVETASEGYSVGFLAHNNPTATFVIKSSKAVTGAKLTLRAASCDIDKDSIESLFGSYVYGLSLSKINPYSGADHDILKVNGSKVALSGTLEGSDSVFKIGGSIADMDLAMDSWGTLTATIDLVEGDNTIVLTHDGAGVNWDYIQIETDAELSWTKTNNDGFVSFDEDYEPEDGGSSGGEEPGGSEEPGEGGGSESSADRFVTGAYVSGTSEDAYYKYTNKEESNLSALFIESVVSVDMDANGDYIVTGTSALMDESQLKAFWGSTNWESFKGDEYIVVTLLANEGETVSVTTSKGTYTLDGDSETFDSTFFSQFIDVDGGTLTEGDTLMTVKVTEDEVETESFTVKLGQIDPSGTVYYDNTLALEAENGALINSADCGGGGTEVMATEGPDSNKTTDATSVKNFNVKGDKIVLQVYAAAAVDEVALDLYAWSTSSSHNDGNYKYTNMVYDEETQTTTDEGYKNLIQVNGTSVAYEGAIAGLTDGSITPLTATISLQKGMNYIVIEIEKSGSSLFGANLGGINVDKVQLSWDGSTKLTEVVGSTGSLSTTLVSVKAADGTATLEAEDGAFINSSDCNNSSEYIGTETSSSATGVTNVKNFNVSGDQIILQVYASAAIEEVSLELYAWSTSSSHNDGNYKYTNMVYDEETQTTTDEGYKNLIQVNGTSVAYEGAIAGLTDGSITPLTATISLQKGMNYIVIEIEATGSGHSLGFNTGGINVDKVELSWTTT